MNDLDKARLYVAVVREQVALFFTWLLIRTGLKTITVQERYDLIMRRERVRILAGELK